MTHTRISGTDYRVRVFHQYSTGKREIKEFNPKDLSVLWSGIEKIRRDRTVYRIEVWAALEVFDVTHN